MTLITGSRRTHGARRLTALRTLFAVAAVAPSLVPALAGAQKPAAEGALDLVLPTGARAVALGQATMGLDGTTESVWGNPSGLARMRGTTAAIHHSQSIGGTADAVAVVAHSKLLGSFGVSASLRDFGPTLSSDETGTEGGTILSRSLIYAASYAASIERLNVGLSYKLLQWRVDCTGPCTGENGVLASTTALDAGAQYSLDPFIPIRFGASVRNVGMPMQVRDEEQADDLPSRLQAGVEVRVPGIDAMVGDTELRVSADMVSELRRMDPSPRLGAELAWQRKIHIRGGYASRDAGFGGPSVGVGYEAGNLAIDFARLFNEVSSTTTAEPTYLSVRYRF